MEIQKPVSTEQIRDIAKELSKYPQPEMPATHHFAPGVYMRELFMPAGTLVIGHVHKTEHFNVVLEGKAVVYSEGITEHVSAPYVFKSGVNAQKVLYIKEDMRWMTIHPTEEKDLDNLEEMLIDKNATSLQRDEFKNLTEDWIS